MQGELNPKRRRRRRRPPEDDPYLSRRRRRPRIGPSWPYLPTHDHYLNVYYCYVLLLNKKTSPRTSSLCLCVWEREETESRPCPFGCLFGLFLSSCGLYLFPCTLLPRTHFKFVPCMHVPYDTLTSFCLQTVLRMRCRHMWLTCSMSTLFFFFSWHDDTHCMLLGYYKKFVLTIQKIQNKAKVNQICTTYKANNL